MKWKTSDIRTEYNLIINEHLSLDKVQNSQEFPSILHYSQTSMDEQQTHLLPWIKNLKEISVRWATTHWCQNPQTFKNISKNVPYMQLFNTFIAKLTIEFRIMAKYF